MNKLTPIIDSLILGIKTMASRKLYICAMIFVPIGCALFFLSLLAPGLPTDVPTGVVDMDHSSMSRSMIRSLDAEEVIEITDDYES
jgi:ABC-2 type transport system permease protein